MKFSTVFSVSTAYTVSSLLSSVAAHGYVDRLSIAGKVYEGWKPFDDPYKQPIPDRATRKIKNDGPVTDWNSPDIVCNAGAPTTAGITVDALPGDEIEFDWKWVPGHQGPVITLLAQCPGNSCEGFSGDSGAVWFKIDAMGLITPPTQAGSGGYWASDKLMDAGGKWTVKIPDGIKAGAYLMRHDIVAMHSAGNPQFYPSCTQLKIGGSGTKVASAAEKVGFPEFYEKDKESVLFNIYRVYDSYQIPGPPVVSFASSGDPPAPADPPSTPADTSTTTTKTGRPSTTTVTKATTVKGGAPTTKNAASPTSSPAQACKVSKKRSTGAQSNSSRDMSKRHIVDRKRRLSFGHDH